MTEPDREPECDLCGDTGWLTAVDLDGESGYEIPCPNGCAVGCYTASDVFTEEAPF